MGRPHTTMPAARRSAFRPQDQRQFRTDKTDVDISYKTDYNGGKEFQDKPLSDFLYISRQTDVTLAAMTTRWMHENHLSTGPAGCCVDSITACAEMVRRGIGWGPLPEICLGGFEGAIRPCLFADGEPFVRDTYVLYQREILKLPQVAAFLDAIKKKHNQLSE